MQLVAYKYYRLYIKKNVSGTGDYFSMNTFSLYETTTGGTDICIGSTATASDNISSTSNAPKAIDNNASTFWETSGTEGDKWFKITLATAKVVRRMVITATTYQTEMPSEYILQGSNDNVNWANLRSINRGLSWTDTTVTDLLSTVIGGKSVLDTGDATLKVVVHRWSDMQYVAETIPDINGDWFMWMDDTSDIMITHIGPAGYRPIADGPITPMVY